MDYGAHADGVTNDSDHIAAAVAAAGGAGTVYFPAGTYYLASAYSPPSGITFTGPVHDKDSVPLAWIKGRVNFGSSQSFSDLKIGPASAGLCAIAAGSQTVSNTSFTRCQFRGGGGDRITSNYTDPHVISLRNQATGEYTYLSYITFTDCSIECNLGVEDATHSKHFDNIYISPSGVAPSMHDILFKGCRFGISNGVRTGAPRFNIEIWNRPGTNNATPQGFRDINFEGCVFEAADDEQLDYSGSTCVDGVTPNDGYSHVTGCTFKGDGKAYAWYSSLVIENGCGHVTVDGNTFYRGAGHAISTSSGTGYNCQNIITNNTIDYTDNVLNTGITNAIYGLIMVNGQGNTVTGNTITTYPTVTAPQIWIKGSGNTVAGNTCIAPAAGVCWYNIDIQAGANNNVVTGNTLTNYKLAPGIRDSGTNNRL
jgi:hypothetical protein